MIRRSTRRGGVKVAALGLLVPAAVLGLAPVAHAVVITTHSPAGTAITDVATIASGTNPSGTLTFQLYMNDGSCNRNNLVFTSVLPVNGNGNYTSAPYTPLVATTYYWVVTYSGDPINTTANSPCGNEVAIIDPATPTVVTMPSGTPVNN